MNIEKLTKLRHEYSTDTEYVENKTFKQAMAAVFSQGKRQLPYAGIPTLLAAPFYALNNPAFDLSSLQVALYGMPMDNGVSNRSGARFGPRALRNIERIGPYHHVHHCMPVHTLRVGDIGDVPFNSRFRLEQSHQDIEDFVGQLADASVIPLGVGGDHSVTYPVLKALGKHRPVSLIHFDAHCDTGGAFDQTRFHHGGPFRNAVLDGVLDPEKTIQIGIRGSSEYLWEFSYRSGMTVIHAEEISSLGVESIIAKARAVVGDSPTYLSFDVDCLDPAFAPGTGTPEVGGLSTREALALLRGLQGINFIGGDVVEVAPQYDATSNTAQIGAQVLFEILSLFCSSPALKK